MIFIVDGVCSKNNKKKVLVQSRIRTGSRFSIVACRDSGGYNHSAILAPVIQRLCLTIYNQGQSHRI